MFNIFRMSKLTKPYFKFLNTCLNDISYWFFEKFHSCTLSYLELLKRICKASYSSGSDVTLPGVRGNVLYATQWKCVLQNLCNFNKIFFIYWCFFTDICNLKWICVPNISHHCANEVFFGIVTSKSKKISK